MSDNQQSTENVHNRCQYCDNDNQDTVIELGYDQKDTLFEVDLFCKSCGTAFTSKYECTQFKQADAEALKKKYPQFAQQFKDNEMEKRKLKAPTPTEVAVQKTQLADTETNKKDIERTNQVAQKTVEETQTNRPQKQ